MVDTVSKEKRSYIMASVPSENTKPEMRVRSILHGMGFRFRLHKKNLPGNPDIVLPRHRKIIFVHGCFWHQHEGCQRSKPPMSNVEFWSDKFTKTVARDKENISRLNDMGWTTLVIWECETYDKTKLIGKIEEFMSSDIEYSDPQD